MSTYFEENLFTFLYAIILICLDTSMIGCSDGNKLLWWSHVSMVICSHAYMLYGLHAHLLFKIHARTFRRFDYYMLLHSNAFTIAFAQPYKFTLIISTHMCTHMDTNICIGLEPKVILQLDFCTHKYFEDIAWMPWWLVDLRYVYLGS